MHNCSLSNILISHDDDDDAVVVLFLLFWSKRLTPNDPENLLNLFPKRLMLTLKSCWVFETNYATKTLFWL